MKALFALFLSVAFVACGTIEDERPASVPPSDVVKTVGAVTGYQCQPTSTNLMHIDICDHFPNWSRCWISVGGFNYGLAGCWFYPLPGFSSWQVQCNGLTYCGD